MPAAFAAIRVSRSSTVRRPTLEEMARRADSGEMFCGLQHRREWPRHRVAARCAALHRSRLAARRSSSTTAKSFAPRPTTTSCCATDAIACRRAIAAARPIADAAVSGASAAATKWSTSRINGPPACRRIGWRTSGICAAASTRTSPERTAITSISIAGTIARRTSSACRPRITFACTTARATVRASIRGAHGAAISDALAAAGRRSGVDEAFSDAQAQRAREFWTDPRYADVRGRAVARRVAIAVRRYPRDGTDKRCCGVTAIPQRARAPRSRLIGSLPGRATTSSRRERQAEIARRSALRPRDRCRATCAAALDQTGSVRGAARLLRVRPIGLSPASADVDRAIRGTCRTRNSQGRRRSGDDQPRRRTTSIA